jgi:ABC transport permease subunit
MRTERPIRVQIRDRPDIQDGRRYGPSTSGAAHQTYVRPGELLLGLINEFLEWFGDLGIFFWRVVRAAVTPPFEFRELFRQLDEIGSMSLPLVALAGAAIGVVLSLEARYSLTRFGAKSLLPAALVFSVIHETGPIITGLVVSGRVGAGIGAELASMKVTEQIDAIEASAVNPYKLLAATRILACILMLPFLTLAADFCGLVMGWVAQAWLSRSRSTSSSTAVSRAPISTISCRPRSRPWCLA